MRFTKRRRELELIRRTLTKWAKQILMALNFLKIKRVVYISAICENYIQVPFP